MGLESLDPTNKNSAVSKAARDTQDYGSEIINKTNIKTGAQPIDDLLRTPETLYRNTSNPTDELFKFGKSFEGIDTAIGNTGKTISQVPGAAGDMLKGLMPSSKKGEAPQVNPWEAYRRSFTSPITVPTEGATHTVIAPYQAATGQSQVDPALMQNLQMLQRMASGQNGSIAQQQLKQGQEANIAASLAQAASTKGGFNPLIARQAMQQNAQSNAVLNQQMAQQRLQEQMAAAQAIAQQGGQMRGQDIQVQLDNARNQLQHAIAQGQITAAEAQQLFAAQQNAILNNANLQKDYLGMSYGVQQGNANLAAQANAAASANQNQFLNAIISGVATMGAGYLGGPLAAGGAKVAVDQALNSNTPSYTTTPSLAGGTPYTQPLAPTSAPTNTYVDLSNSAPGNYVNVRPINQAHGGFVPGKAPKSGDTEENDIVPAKLSPGEFVLPRSLTSDKELMDLVHKKMAEKGLKKSEEKVGFADVLKAHKELTSKISALHAQIKKG